MSPTSPALVALDFDGVICDGLLEYFTAAWTAYCAIWLPAVTTPPPDLADRFYPLRPVVETGWEMPVLLRALQLGHTADAILADWPTLAQHIIRAEALEPAALAAAVDGGRDRRIATDLDHWLAQHRFYPGVLAQLQRWLATETVKVAIVTTKEGRFVRQLLDQQGLSLGPDQIWGKEVKQPKYQTLHDLRQQYGWSELEPIWFVEDRLEALELVQQQPDLATVQLFLADWGYNLDRDRQQVQGPGRLRLLSLPQFCADFSTWLGAPS